MTTTYPTDLPLPPPPDRWNGTLLDMVADVTDPVTSWRDVTMRCEVEAPDAETAERRALAIHVYDYDDNVKPGETADASPIGGDRWSVLLHWGFYDT